jgi:hypothetical protein
MSVIFSPEVEAYLFELTEILYQKEYFGFKESAVRYVTDLIFEIRDRLPTSVKRIAPEHFSKYGKKLHYVSFRKNKDTQWYVFFNLYEDKGEFIYLIRYISNNHVIAQYL